ncbi:hypothetical protein [Rubrivivax gelatinosus]|uniref:hypothetical protein n=1 Tax=Rubrivivax gelatinosus TaxID=28068 RepID=UPI0005C21176|nr:hypothetical protein [Rubrivivax gelatinosus]MBG6083040.1 small basic protein [Rubrivivax gelatinosus]
MLFALCLLGFACTIVLSLARSEAPTGRLGDGLRIVITAALQRLFRGGRRTWRAVYDSVWVLETLKNMLQALALAGGGMAAYIAADEKTRRTLETPATLVGFLVVGVLMGLVSRRIEGLRDQQADALRAQIASLARGSDIV